jgi:hypothetical protein
MLNRTQHRLETVTQYSPEENRERTFMKVERNKGKITYNDDDKGDTIKTSPHIIF